MKTYWWFVIVALVGLIVEIYQNNTSYSPPVVEVNSYAVGGSYVSVARSRGADGQWRTCKLTSNAGGAEMVCR